MSCRTLKLKQMNQNPAIIEIRIGKPVDDYNQVLKCKWPFEQAFKPLRDVKLLRDYKGLSSIVAVFVILKLPLFYMSRGHINKHVKDL